MNFKQFLTSFLGALAALWVTALIVGVMVIVAVVSMIAMGLTSTTSGSVTPDKHSVLHLDLSGEIVEYPRARTLFDELSSNNSQDVLALNKLIGAIDRAAEDNHIDGIFIDCNGALAGVAQRQAIYDALLRFKSSAPDKWIYAYGDVITQGDYLTACVADSLFINPCGMIDIHGLEQQGMYFKDLLDKVGVKMQAVKVGTYKSAVEPYLLTGPSAPAIEQTQLYLGNIWSEIRRMIARGRHVNADSVNAWANSISATKDINYYLRNKMADAAVYRHEIIKKLESLTDVDNLRLVEVADYCDGLTLPKKTDTRIGVYYASGEIYDSGNSGITAEKMVSDLLKIAEDDDVDALVLRVNSPGGSAFASEQIWKAVDEYKAMTGKPVYVSMSDYAASGGYYVSCGADRIYAEPTTLTGSIGIFGLIPDAHELITGKLGVNVVTTSTNPGGVMPDIFSPMTPTQQAEMQAYVSRGYELFVKRVAAGRGMTVDKVKEIAEGRVWDGARAQKIGLVDRLGGLETALADLAKELNVEDYRIVEYPTVNRKWWEDIVDSGMNDIEMAILNRRLGEDAILYKAIETVRGMAPVQARMDFITIKL